MFNYTVRRIYLVAGLALLVLVIFVLYIFLTVKSSNKKSPDTSLNTPDFSKNYYAEQSNQDSSDVADQFPNIILPSAGQFQNRQAGQKNLGSSGKLITLESNLSNGFLFKLSSEEILDFSVNQIGDGIVFVAKTDGTLVETDFRGTRKSKLTKKFLPKLKKVILPDRFSFKGILVKSDSTKVYYDFKKEIEKKLPDKIRDDIKWSSDGDKIIYFYDDSLVGGSNIAIANPDNTNWKIVVSTANPYLEFYWPHKNAVAILVPAYSYYDGEMFVIDPERPTIVNKQHNFESVLERSRPILSNFRKINFKWSSNPSILLYSTADSVEDSQLQLYTTRPINQITLQFYAFPEDCVWSKTIQDIFCFTTNYALIKNGLIKAREDLLPQNVSLWQLNINEGKVTEVFAPKQVFDPEKILLSPNEDYLIFKNKLDNFLYSIKLR